jgi:hypothetical protein
MFFEKTIDHLTEKLFSNITDKEIQKRMFLKECRFNLSLLSILDWKEENKRELSAKYVLPKLETKYSLLMLNFYNADLFSIVKNNITNLLPNVDEKIPDSNDIITQIVNKIEVLKVISDFPDELNHANIHKRISNLRESLINIIQKLEK